MSTFCLPRWSHLVLSSELCTRCDRYFFHFLSKEVRFLSLGWRSQGTCSGSLGHPVRAWQTATSFLHLHQKRFLLCSGHCLVIMITTMTMAAAETAHLHFLAESTTLLSMCKVFCLYDVTSFVQEMGKQVGTPIHTQSNGFVGMSKKPKCTL